MGPLTDVELAGIDAASSQHIHLVQQDVRVHHNTVPDDSVYLRPAYAGGDQVKLKLPLLIDHGVPGIIAAGISDDAVNFPCKIVDDFPLAFVAPLSPDNGICRHSLTALLNTNRLNIAQNEAVPSGARQRKY